MYAFTSSGPRKSLHALVICTIVGTILLFTLSSVDGIAYAWALQLGAIMMATVGIYLAARYSLCEYRYEITDSGLIAADGTPVYDLTITMITGRYGRRQEVTRIGLRDVGEVYILDRATYMKKSPALRSIPHRFRYENTPFAPLSCYITVPEEEALLIIPPDQRMADILAAAADQNRIPDDPAL